MEKSHASQRLIFLSRSLAVFLFLSLITYLSLAAHPLGGNNLWIMQFKGSDKLVHFTLYCLFCLTVTWAYHPYIRKRRTFMIIFFFIILYGAFMEVCQGYIFPVGRTFSLLDIAANTVGVIISVIGYNFYHRIF
jgi:VanZ family protein